MKICMISDLTAFSLISCHWISVNASFKLKIILNHNEYGLSNRDPWTTSLAVQGPSIGPNRGLRRDLGFHLDKALPNRRVLILACSETWIWIDNMANMVMILLIQFILGDENTFDTCLRIQSSAWFMKVSWYNIGQ